MSKELEGFRDILWILSAVSGCEVDMNSEHIKIVKQALQRLEAINNSNPSEALKCLEKLQSNIRPLNDYYYGDEQRKSYDTIKQALIKAQEQEKVLSIIKKKRVDIDLLNISSNVEEYNFKVSLDKELTKEEFDLLKRYCDDWLFIWIKRYWYY